jgi:hypothetical protein
MQQASNQLMQQGIFRGSGLVHAELDFFLIGLVLPSKLAAAACFYRSQKTIICPEFSSVRQRPHVSESLLSTYAAVVTFPLTTCAHNLSPPIFSLFNALSELSASDVRLPHSLAGCMIASRTVM